MSGRIRAWLGIVLVAAAAHSFLVRSALAQVPLAPSGQASSPEARARPHFERALELYRAGRYALALDQLHQASALDPNGKDLFFNLALVHEKLGQLPEAITALGRFIELEPDEAERERARIAIERIQGALSANPPREWTPPACPKLPPPPAPPQGIRPVVVGTAAVAFVALVVGSIFGVKALADDVAGARTSASLSITQLRERGDRAEREALVADIAFAISAAAGGTAIGLVVLDPAATVRRGGMLNVRSEF